MDINKLEAAISYWDNLEDDSSDQTHVICYAARVLLNLMKSNEFCIVRKNLLIIPDQKEIYEKLNFM